MTPSMNSRPCRSQWHWPRPWWSWNGSGWVWSTPGRLNWRLNCRGKCHIMCAYFVFKWGWFSGLSCICSCTFQASYFTNWFWTTSQSVPVQLSEAVASRLISVEVYNDYTASERKFVQLATDWDWTQSETQAVLKILKDKHFQLENVRPDLIRRVLLFEHLVYST